MILYPSDFDELEPQTPVIDVEKDADFLTVAPEEEDKIFSVNKMKIFKRKIAQNVRSLYEKYA